MTSNPHGHIAGGWEALLLAAGRDANSIPAALAEAAKQGKVGGCLTMQPGPRCTQQLCDPEVVYNATPALRRFRQTPFSDT